MGAPTAMSHLVFHQVNLEVEPPSFSSTVPPAEAEEALDILSLLPVSLVMGQQHYPPEIKFGWLETPL